MNWNTCLNEFKKTKIKKGCDPIFIELLRKTTEIINLCENMNIFGHLYVKI